jgi:hypothetical protein
MKRRVLLPLLALLNGAATFVRADQADDAIAAAMKLSAAINYSWTTTLVQNSHTSTITGKTSAAGYSLLTFTGFSGSGTNFSAKPGGGVNTVFLGDSKYVIDNNGTWVMPTDTSRSAAAADTGKESSTGNNNSGGSSGRGRRSRGGGIGGIGGGGSPGQRRGSGSNSGDQDTAATASGPKLPSGVNLPHEELAIIASNYSDMHTADGVVSGTLTEWGADQLLIPPGWTQSPPDKAAGTFRLWIKDGAVTKYELKLTAETGPGGVAIKGGLAKTITVELTDVGNTQVTVPPAAKLKLGV